jgi:hypothetical protein
MKFRKLIRSAASIGAKVASLTPQGRIAKLASFGAGALGKLTQTAKTMLLPPTTQLSQLAQRIVGKRKKRRYKGISDREMMELLKLQMLVGKRSLPYQMAVYKALTGKLK